MWKLKKDIGYFAVADEYDKTRTKKIYYIKAVLWRVAFYIASENMTFLGSNPRDCKSKSQPKI